MTGFDGLGGGPVGPVEPVGGGFGDGAHIEYELDDWAVESRQMLRQLLVGHDVAHVWEAGTLVIPEVFEQVVDDLVDQVAATFAGTLDDPEVPRVVFDVADFDDELVDELAAALTEVGVEWVLEPTGELVVAAEHTVTVEQLVESLEFPHALPLSPGAPVAGGDPDDDIDTGVEIDPDRVLGGLFVAADRLARSATDPHGVLDTLELAAELDAAAIPFGFDEPVWATLRHTTASLVELLGDAASSDDDVESAAVALRDQLRPWV